MLGRFCGTLHNFENSYYSTKKNLIINQYTDIKREKSNLDFFEFEVTFRDKESLNPKTYQISKSNLKQANYGTLIEKTKCDRVFDDCSGQNYDACVLSSPGYPGVYLKNMRCLHYIKNIYYTKSGLSSQKLILINENLQLDGALCHTQLSSKLSNTIFCDNGTRNSNECMDYLNIYDGMNTADSPISSLLLMKKVCGMGRLPKIVTKRNALVLDFISGPDGYFANTGFLFYALNQKQYFDNFYKFNSFVKIKTNQEMNSIKMIEKLQVENCNSDMNTCGIVVNDETLDFIYSNESTEYPIEDFSSQFKIGYLYAINQFHPNSFTLKYTLRTKKYNTIAIYLDKYQPAGKVKTDDMCQVNYLSIETNNQMISSFQDYYYDDEDSTGDIKLGTVSNKTVPLRFKFDENDESQKSSLLKICDPSEITNKTTRFYLIKTSNNHQNPKKLITKSRTNLVVNYFSANQQLISSQLFDFKITYEFFDFDWKTYQENSICNFVYDMNRDESIPSSGYITNPQASIFYKASDDFLKCRYKLIGKHNQYVKLNVELIDFNLNDFENVYFTNKASPIGLNDKCNKLDKRILIKDIEHPWFNSNSENDILHDSSETSNLNEESNFDFDSRTNENYSNKIFETKICLCKLKLENQYYVSKYEALEIEFFIKLNKSEDISKIRNKFRIKYEFMNRKCNDLVIRSPKSTQKGQILYAPITNGVQVEISNLIDNTTQVNGYLTEYETEILNLKLILEANLNFFCKFHIKAPKNKFIYIEFSEFSIGRKCTRNHIKLFSSYSKKNSEHSSNLDSFFKGRPLPFISLCASSDSNTFNNLKNKFKKSVSLDKRNELMKSSKISQNTVVAHFLRESNINPSLSCYSSKQKVCFMTNELEDSSNPFYAFSSRKKEHESSKINREFQNELVVEILAFNLKKFYFDLRYHYYQVDFETLTIENNPSLNSDQNKILFNVAQRQIYKNMNEKSENCDFRCGTSLNETSSSVQICLDETLICDNEIHCIFNESDEINCKFYFFELEKI